MSKKIWTVLLIVVMSFALVATGCSSTKETATTGSSSSGGDKSPIQVGVIADQTGTASYYSKLTVDGINVAVDEVNANGGINGRPLKLVIENDNGDPTTSAAKAKKLADDTQTVAIISATGSGGTLQNQTVTEQMKIVNLSPTNVNNPLTEGKTLKYFFEMMPKDSEWVNTLFKITSQKHKKLGIVVDNTQTGISVRDSWVKKLEALGVTPAAVEQINVGATDATPSVLRMRNAGVDGILVGGSSVPEIALFMRGMKSVGWSVPVYGTWALTVPSFPKMGGDSMEGLIAVDAINDESPAIKKLQDTMRKKLGNDYTVSAFNACGYTSVMLLSEALKQSGTDREKVREALEKIEFTSILGTNANAKIKFDLTNRQGVNPSEITLRVIKGGKYTMYK
ncbi:ABC transporter substrate-binding protein [Paradesulfitobacterium aromaticivorans]